MRLYHFTAREHLHRIVTDGFLKTVESNISRRREHAGPDVVWLTSDPSHERHGHGLQGSALDKTAVRFTVEVDQRSVRKWRTWAAARGIDREWMQVLASVGGSYTWWVSESPILASQWVEVLDTATGEPVLRRVSRGQPVVTL